MNLALLLIWFLLTNPEPQFREIVEYKSTLIENNKKEKYTLLTDSLGVYYKVKWNKDPDFGFIGLLWYKDETTRHYVNLGKPLQFFPGNFFIPWVDVP